MKHKFDTKFYFKTGHCFNCQSEIEHKLRVKGLYPLWERIKVFQNEISVLKERLVYFQEAYDSLKPESEFVTSEGRIMKFEHIGNWQSVKDDIKLKIDDIYTILPVAEKELEGMLINWENLDVEEDIKRLVRH